VRPGSSGGQWLEELPPHDFAAAVTPELRDALVEAIDQVDVAAREALVALADDGSPGQIQAIADRHHILAAALRQRLHRARRRLQPQLAGWMVAA
jgi:DNA-directed RNA polymerase specialized sigma24 family protein